MDILKTYLKKPVFFGNVALWSVVSRILQESISAHPIERNSCDPCGWRDMTKIPFSTYFIHVILE